MDAVYLISCNVKKSSLESISELLYSSLELRLYFRTHYYGEEFYLPTIVVESEIFEDEGEKYRSTIWITTFEDENRMKSENIFPLDIKGIAYFPVFSLESSEPIFLLRLLISILKKDNYYKILGVNNEIIDLEKAMQYEIISNLNWAYTEVVDK